MILPDGALRPKIDPSARIAPNAVISGDVEIGPNTSVGFGAVIVAESGPVRIAGDTVIMDTAVLRGIRGCPLIIGSHVLIGPRAVLTGCRIENEAFIATGATIFNGTTIEVGAEVRINAIVHLRTRLAARSVVPLGWIAVGDPARILPPERHEDIWAVQKDLDFPSFVFGVERPAEGESFMPDVMPRYAGMLAKRHMQDG
ncbi:gamma carbonic anhydrase family protein [Rhodobacterales bacterium]|nr:gamma carbonic anhydrase family protein [Rhodobacterales bacterium]